MSARTVIADAHGTSDEPSGGLIVDCPGFEVVSIERPFLGAAYVEIPSHLVPELIAALMKAARIAAVDLPPGLAAGYIAARGQA
jgi:hypothetical protein